MKLSTVKRISKESLDPSGKALPAWVDNLLSPLNDYLEKVYIAISGRLTFGDNIYSSSITVELTHNVELKVNPQTVNPVLGCILINAGGNMVTGFKWRNIATSSVGLTVQLSGATTATCTVVFLLK